MNLFVDMGDVWLDKKMYTIILASVTIVIGSNLSTFILYSQWEAGIVSKARL
jgi:hypothetical protein